MAIMLKKQNETIVLDNTDEAFADTVFANEPFIIEISKLPRAETINILTGSVDDEGVLKQGDYSKLLFIASITNVDGFVDENQQPIGLEDGVSEIIWEYSPDILVNAIKAKIQSFNAVEEKKKETSEQDLVGIPAGQ